MSPTQALEIISRALPGATQAERHFVWAFTRHETAWGTGWHDNALGQLSHNWGAVKAPAGQGFTYNDPLRGTDRIHTFRIYATDELGAADAGLVALKPNVREALRRNDGWTAVQRMGANGYFEADPALYASALQRNYRLALAGAPGEPALLRFERPSGVFPLLLGCSAVLAVFYWKEVRTWFQSPTAKN